jgi:hypothetical protein
MASRLAPRDTTTAAALLRARFTPTDIRDFCRLAAPNLQRGLWSSVRRQSGSTFDRFEILLSTVGYPALTVERDCRGTYRLWWHPEEQEKQQLHSGPALDCLTLIGRLTCCPEHPPKYKVRRFGTYVESRTHRGLM